MGNYISQTDLVRYMSSQDQIDTTDDTGADAITVATANECIEGAEAVYDGKVAAKYTVPHTGTIPPLCIDICLVLASYKLMQRRQMIPPVIQTAYDNSMKLLDQIAAGDIVLGGDAAVDSDKIPYFDYTTRQFNRTNFTGW